MPVVDVRTDPDALTLTITADFAADVPRVWQVYADPRQLERVWGPPTYPATVVDHSLTPGGRVNYFMTGPDGDKYYGYWVVDEVDEPHRFSFTDGFANADFTPDTSMAQAHSVYSFTPHGQGTRAVFASTYDSAEGLQQVLDMGVIEGSTEAINQIDGLLSDG